MPRVIITSAEVDGDQVTATGTVDGKTHVARCWKSHLDTLPNKAAKVAHAAALLKAQWQRDQPKQVVDLAATVDV